MCVCVCSGIREHCEVKQTVSKLTEEVSGDVHENDAFARVSLIICLSAGLATDYIVALNFFTDEI